MKNIDRLYYLAISLKAIESFFELLSGILLLFIDSKSLTDLISFIFRQEMLEDPSDFIINLLINASSSLSLQSKSFIALLFIINGLIKIFIIIALLSKKLIYYSNI